METLRLKDLMRRHGHHGLFVPGQADPLKHWAKPGFLIRITADGNRFHMWNTATNESYSGGVEEYAKVFGWNIELEIPQPEARREALVQHTERQKYTATTPLHVRMQGRPIGAVAARLEGRMPRKIPPKTRHAMKYAPMNPARAGTILYSRQAMMDSHPGPQYPLTRTEWAELIHTTIGCSHWTANRVIDGFIYYGFAARTEAGIIPTGKPLPYAKGMTSGPIVKRLTLKEVQEETRRLAAETRVSKEKE